MMTPFGNFDLGGTGTAEAVSFGASAGGTETPFGNFSLGSDMAEAQQMQPFVPAPAAAQGMAWWESVIAYGATRAIDNRFGPVPVAGNTNPGTFGGQNGRTYSNTPNASGGSVAARQQAQQQANANGLAQIAALAALAFAFV